MQQNSRYIIFTAATIGIISCVYFLSLLCALPFFISLCIIPIALFFLYRWLITDATPRYETPISWWPIILLIAGIFVITTNALQVSMKYGGWDAWSMWNFHAKYLADPLHWRKLFQNVESDHVDYPLGLPSFIGFFLRLFTGPVQLLIPFAFSFLVMLLIPVLIFTEQAHKNIVIATAALFLFARNNFYIAQGVSEYADTLLAFFFLCAFICKDHISDNKKFITLSALFLGICAWTKNEGAVMAILFLLFYAPLFFAKRNIKYTLAGLLLPITTLLIFKLSFPATNDLVNTRTAHSLSELFNGEKWTMICNSFMLNLSQKFYFVKIGIYLYALLCIIQRRLPGRDMILLLTCMLICMTAYLFSTHSLSWHLTTSQDRVMHQLMPAVMYVLVVKFSRIRFSLPAQEAL